MTSLFRWDNVKIMVGNTQQKLYNRLKPIRDLLLEIERVITYEIEIT